jgi:hypothetical protein
MVWNAGLSLAAASNTEQAKFSGGGDNKMPSNKTRCSGDNDSRQFVVHFTSVMALRTTNSLSVFFDSGIK